MGSTSLEVKQKLKKSTLVGGGLRGSICEGCGPPWWPEDHHQGGGGGGVTAETEQLCALQVTLWLCGAHNKICKNKMKMRNES